MAVISLERISCSYLRDAVLAQYDSASSGLPSVPGSVVVPDGDVNYATTKQTVSFRGQCGTCQVRFSGQANLRSVDGAHVVGDSRRKVTVYSVIAPSISIQKSGQCSDEQTS